MSPRDDGGPAYPGIARHQAALPAGLPDPLFDGGMSLRDAFAIATLQGNLAYSGQFDTTPANVDTEDGKAEYLKIAQNCYRYADAMLEARK